MTRTVGSRRARGLGVLGTTAAVAVLASADTPVRGGFAALALVAAPGLAAAWSLRGTTWQTRLATAVAATVVVNVAVAQIMLITGTWSPRGGVVAVAAISGCVLAHAATRPPPPQGAAAAAAPPPAMPSSLTEELKVEVLRPTELGETECEQWREMQRRLPHLDNPFLAPEFAQAVGRFHDNARVAVLSQGRDVVGFFPFDRHRFGIGRPLAAGLTDCQGLVHLPGVELDAKELLRGCGLSVFEFDHLIDGQACFDRYTTTRAASPIMDLSSGYEAFQAHVRKGSPKFLKTTLSKARKLEREIGDVRFDYDARDLDALRQLMSWKSAQYRRTGRADRFAQPWIVALVEHLLGADGVGCAGTLSMLYAGGRPIAGHFGLRSEKILVGWFPAYDTTFAKYSPGLIQHLRMAEAAAGAGIHHIDMGKGGREYKDSLKSRELMVAEGRVLRAAPSASAYWAVRAPVRTARNLVLAHPRLFRVADRALKQYGRVTSARSSPPGRWSGPPHLGQGEGADRSSAEAPR